MPDIYGHDHAGELAHVRFAGKPRTRGVPTAGIPTPSAGDNHLLEPKTRSVRTAFAEDVLERAGLDGTLYRGQSLERRVPSCLRALKASSEAAALQRLRERPDLLVAALNALLIGVTGFFRDEPVFETIRRVVIPALAAREGTLRVWSVGCSSGEELLSVAMLFGEGGLIDRCDLLGTDCRPDAIAAATEGLYSSEAIAAVPATLASRYFERQSEGWRTRAQLRKALRWRVADVWARTEAGPWDLVLWRNAAIYFNHGPSRRVMADLVRTIPAGGFLVLGKAERAPASVPLRRVARCIYCKG